MRRKHQEEGHSNQERWLLTYADLITLLMIFFVLLYTLSKIDTQKFKAVAESLSAAIGSGTPAKVQVQTDNGSSIIELNQQEGNAVKDNGKNQTNDTESKTIQAIKKQIDNYLAANHLSSKAETDIEERGLVVSIRDTLLFSSGSAQVTSTAQSILQKLCSILAPLPNYIKVEGHTDNAPIHNSQFPSNWELSTSRAVNVVHILVSQNIAPERLSAVGYGEYRPVVPNTSDANMSRNRRVDLVIIRSKYDVTEPQQQSAQQPSSDTSMQNTNTGRGSGVYSR